MATRDIDEILQTGEQILLAVDQAPFEVERTGIRNTFCLLVPLLTEDGAALQRGQFLNRERVWWMVRPSISPQDIAVGMIWSAPVEQSREFGKSDLEKDYFQARRADIAPGARRFAQVITLAVTRPDLEELLNPEGIPWPYPTLKRVIARGAEAVVGPFSSSYDFARRRLILKAVTPGDPHVFRLERAAFDDEAKLREFRYEANQWDSKAPRREVDLALVHERDLAVLEEKGERLDAATDAQVVNWALELLTLPKKDRQVFKAVADKAGQLAQRDLAAGAGTARMERFIRLCKSRERVVDLGSEVAAVVAEQEGYRDLVARHLESITSERVARAVAERRDEIDKATAEAQARLAGLEEKIAGIEAEYARKLQAWERDFAAKQAERLGKIEEREAAVDRLEKEMGQRLQGLVETYKTEAKAIGDRLLAEIPLLQRLGVLDGRAGTSGRQAPAPGGLELPAFLNEKRPHGLLGEEEFLRQFESCVTSRGFVFERDDLVNFHVLVKTGLWTVLTGPSGLGKSSLPRLYAEALGCGDEFLLIPVRPDWLDDRDVVGAYNALSGRYEPAPSGLVERLIAAAEDERVGRGGIYIVCLDEMNLARVEHYFAQFLSILEQPPERRRLNLFARGATDPADPYNPHVSLRLGSNLRLVGTVNLDETTHFFSPKVIDRAAIASFERPDLRVGLGKQARPQAPLSMVPVHLRDYLAWVRPGEAAGEAVDLLLKVDEALRRARLGLGFRLRDRILRYVSSARHLLGGDRALDLAIFQNVLPALRSSAPRYAELLKELGTILTPGRFARTAGMLQALQDDPESDFFHLL